MPAEQRRLARCGGGGRRRPAPPAGGAAPPSAPRASASSAPLRPRRRPPVHPPARRRAHRPRATAGRRRPGVSSTAPPRSASDSRTRPARRRRAARPPRRRRSRAPGRGSARRSAGPRVIARAAPLATSAAGLPTASCSASARCSCITWMRRSSRATAFSVEGTDEADVRLVDVAGDVVGPEREEAARRRSGSRACGRGPAAARASRLPAVLRARSAMHDLQLDQLRGGDAGPDPVRGTVLRQVTTTTCALGTNATPPSASVSAKKASGPVEHLERRLRARADRSAGRSRCRSPARTTPSTSTTSRGHPVGRSPVAHRAMSRA